MLQTLKTLNHPLGTSQPHRQQAPQGQINGFLWALKFAVCQALDSKPLKSLQRFTILLARPTPQATGTPRPDQWLPMGVQACRLPGVKRLKRFKPLKRLTIVLARPTPQATGTPRPDQWLLMGVQACRLPAFKRLKRLRSFLARPTPQATGTPRPAQWLLMGVQACRLPGVKCLQRLQPAGKRHPKARSTAAKATSIAS